MCFYNSVMCLALQNDIVQVLLCLHHYLSSLQYLDVCFEIKKDHFFVNTKTLLPYGLIFNFLTLLYQFSFVEQYKSTVYNATYFYYLSS